MIKYSQYVVNKSDFQGTILCNIEITKQRSL